MCTYTYLYIYMYIYTYIYIQNERSNYLFISSTNIYKNRGDRQSQLRLLIQSLTLISASTLVPRSGSWLVKRRAFEILTLTLNGST